MSLAKAARRAQKNASSNAAANAQQESARTNAEMTGIMQNYITDPNAGFTLYGTDKEKVNQAAQLSQAGVLTGVNMFDIGADAQQYRQGLKDRLAGSDPVSEYMMAGRNRNMANVARSMSGRGIAGGVGAAALSQAQREADAGINAQMYENQRTNQRELNALVKDNQKIVGNALAQGSDRGLANDLSTNAGSGITLICTELKRQGILPKSVWEADRNFGLKLWQEEPEIMAGYTIVAEPIVQLMKKSKIVTYAAAAFAVPWAYHVAGKWNPIGAVVMVAGKTLCRIVYRYHLNKLKRKVCL